MTVVVEAPPGYEPERRYILEVVLSDWLGLDWQLRSADRSDVRIALAEEPDGPGLRRTPRAFEVTSPTTSTIRSRRSTTGPPPSSASSQATSIRTTPSTS